MTAAPNKNQGRIKDSGRQLSSKEIEFAQRVAGGATDSEAFREAYKPKTKNKDSVHRMAHLVSERPRVIREIVRLRAKIEKKVLLSLNDRLAILARTAQVGGSSASMLNASTRAIQVYSEISGDRAPDRSEVSGPGGAPIPVAVEATVRRLSARERVARMVADRRQREAVLLAEPPRTPPGV